MTKLARKDLEQVENRLRERQRGLLEEVRSELDDRENQHLAAVMGNHPGDSGDISLADTLADLNIARVHRQIRELREIDAKLAQLREGDINVCADCGNAIGLPRLLANPISMRCVSCQQKHEQMFAQDGHPGL